MAHVRYNNTIVIYESNDSIDSKGAEISFLNVGDGAIPPAGANVIINGYTLRPGFGVSFDGNENELDVTKYSFQFSGPGVRVFAVFQKNYM